MLATGGRGGVLREEVGSLKMVLESLGSPGDWIRTGLPFPEASLQPEILSLSDCRGSGADWDLTVYKIRGT